MSLSELTSGALYTNVPQKRSTRDKERYHKLSGVLIVAVFTKGVKVLHEGYTLRSRIGRGRTGDHSYYNVTRFRKEYPICIHTGAPFF